MEDKNFLALDLEMNSFEGSDRPGKIIQVGVAIGTLNAFRFNSTNPLNKLPYIEKSWYVYPGEKIYNRITELTGITDDDVQKHSTPLEIIHHELQVLMSTYSCYVNPVVWGNGDSELLKTEIREAIGCCHIFGHRDIDVKTLHSFQLISNNKKTNSPTYHKFPRQVTARYRLPGGVDQNINCTDRLPRVPGLAWTP